MKAQRINQKVKVKIDDIHFMVSPLKFEERTAVQSELLKAELKRDPMGLVVAARLAMNMRLKNNRVLHMTTVKRLN